MFILFVEIMDGPFGNTLYLYAVARYNFSFAHVRSLSFTVLFYSCSATPQFHCLGQKFNSGWPSFSNPSATWTNFFIRS